MTTLSRFAALAIMLTATLRASGNDSTPNQVAYHREAAAAYLDGRLEWWSTWPTAARDQKTFCVSCHTTLPYSLARPKLRQALGETALSAGEQKMLDNVVKRVRLWREVQPFYPDEKAGPEKTVESRGTESILNALVLTSFDGATGKLSPDARQAFENMWAEQLKAGENKGAWQWLQFHNAPFEGDSQYYGAVLAAIAVGSAPEAYRNLPAIKGNLESLRQYLTSRQAQQTLLDRLVLVWASTNIEGLLTLAQRNGILQEAIAKQKADGGFSLSSLIGNWKRHDNTPLETKSDGYATALVTYVLQQTGIKRNESCLKQGLEWLVNNQSASEGRWFAYSLNKQRDLGTDVGKFMSDAATAYAVLSLEAR